MIDIDKLSPGGDLRRTKKCLLEAKEINWKEREIMGHHHMPPST